MLSAAISLVVLVWLTSFQTVATSSTALTPHTSLRSPSVAGAAYVVNGSSGLDILSNAIVHHKQVARAISDQTWNELLQNGCRLVNMMSITDSQAAELMPGKPSTAESIWCNYPSTSITLLTSL